MTRKIFALILGLTAVIAMAAVLPGCAPKQAQTGDTVRVNYTGRFQSGEVFDTSAGGEPLEFTLGQSQVITGFENAVLGMKAGDSVTVTIPVDEAYGPVREDLILEVGRDKLPEGLEPEPGMQLQSTQPDGSTMTFTITEVYDSTVMVDGNHPLAGQTLIFDIELVEIVNSGKASFASLPLTEALENGRPTFAEFGSDTCAPCKQMKPILEELSTEYKGRMDVVVVDVYDNMEFSRQYNIMAIPTQIIFDEYGQEIDRHTGFWARDEIIIKLRELGLD